MEKSVLGQDSRENIKTEGEHSFNSEESSIKLKRLESKSLIDLQTEEQLLKTQLENLKKENFSMEASIQAWKTTYEQMQNELADTESKLNKIYNQIWSEREEFCKRANNFDNQYGILSNWWKKKVDEIFNPIQEKSNEKYQEEVEKLEMNTYVPQEVEDLEKKGNLSEIFEMASQHTESFVHNSKEAPNESSTEPVNQSKDASLVEEIDTIKEFASFNESGTTEFIQELPEKHRSPEGQGNEELLESIASEILKQKQKKKKVRFSKENDRITFFNNSPESLKMKFFSIVDTETVKRANRFRNTRKTQYFRQATK